MPLQPSFEPTTPTLSPEEDEARFVTRLAMDLIAAHLNAFHSTEIDGPGIVDMVRRLLEHARRKVGTPFEGEVA